MCPVVNGHARTEDHMGFDNNVASEPCVEGEGYSRRIDQCGTVAHCRPAKPRLEAQFGNGELRPVIDAKHFVLACDQGCDPQATRPRYGNNVSQVIFVLAVGIADGIEQRQSVAPVDGHQPSAANFDFLFLPGRVPVFPYGRKTPSVQNKPSVTARLSRLEPQGGDGVLLCCKRMAHGDEGFRAHQRRIGEDDENVVIPSQDCLSRGKHRMRGSKPFGLDCDFATLRDGLGLRGHRVMAWACHNGDISRPGLKERTQDVAEHRPAGKLMQNLGMLRAHPRAVASGEDNGKTRAALMMPVNHGPYFSMRATLVTRRTAQGPSSKTPDLRAPYSSATPFRTGLNRAICHYGKAAGRPNQIREGMLVQKTSKRELTFGRLSTIEGKSKRFFERGSVLPAEMVPWSSAGRF